MAVEKQQKTIGIVADNYKVEKFKNDLADKLFIDVTVTSFSKTTSTIKIKCEESRVDEIRKICQLVELHYKRGN